MRVRVEDELAAVTMPLPFSDHLHVNAALDRARDEHPTKRPVRERRQSQPLACIRQRLARAFDVEQPLVVRLALAQLLNERARLRIDRNDETSRCLASEYHDT